MANKKSLDAEKVEPAAEAAAAAAAAATQPEPLDADTLQSHEDLLSTARRSRAQEEANRRLNRVHEYEMQVKSQWSRDPKTALKDAKGRSWEDYHDIFWQAKRGLIYADDPEGLNKYLAEVLGEETSIAWMDESE